MTPPRDSDRITPPLTETDLSELVRRLASRGQLPPPRVALTRRTTNDNAKVRHRRCGPVMLFDPGALARPDEIEQQAAHELGHVAAPTTIVSRHAAAIILGVGVIAALLFITAPAVPFTNVLLVLTALVVSGDFLAITLWNPRLQRDELAADAFAASLVGTEPVLHWLRAMADRHPPRPEPSPFGLRLTTHPSQPRRIAALRAAGATA